MVSQLVLLGTTYIQFLTAVRFLYFFALFGQAVAVLFYGLSIRSRSMVITPIGFLALTALTVLFGRMPQSFITMMLTGCFGLALLILGISAVIMRGRLKQVSEHFSEWEV
jgi:hypothetical protein